MKPKLKLKIAVDVAMTLLLLLLMAYELVGEAAHEWLGMGLFVLIGHCCAEGIRNMGSHPSAGRNE